MLRRLILVAFAIVLAAPVAVSPAPAEARGSFEITYFPHAGLDVEFANDWGRPRDGGERTHRGNDIFSPKGTEIVAVADGFVTEMGQSKRPGYKMRIRHADGWESFYFHLNNDTPGTDNNRGGPERAFAEGIEVGMFVTAGTVIGYVGDSGNAEPTAPHTHFELHRFGRAVNPYNYLRTAWKRHVRYIEIFEELELLL